MTMQRIVVAITGASGSIYGLRLVEELLKRDCRVTLLTSKAGLEVLRYETGLEWEGTTFERRQLMRDYFGGGRHLEHVGSDDLFAPIASGSSAPDAVIVAPCSMGTAGRIAAGLSGNLIERVADVALKERRELLLVPRETPLNAVHLENRRSCRRCRPSTTGRRAWPNSSTSWSARFSTTSASTMPSSPAGGRKKAEGQS